MDSHKRSVAKALSWRLIAMLITAGVGYAWTGDKVFALGMGLADSVVKIFVYYLHERAWIRMPESSTSALVTGSQPSIDRDPAPAH